MDNAIRPTGVGFWRAHSEGWKASGLTQVAYCEREGISHNSFVYQHNRLAVKSKTKPLSFIETKPELSMTSNSTACLQLMLPNGIRIGIGGEVVASLLQTVLGIAVGLKC